MPEKPPIMPPLPSQPEKPLTLPELEAEIKRLTEEIAELMRQKDALPKKKKKSSRGDELPDIEGAAELEPKPGHSDRVGGGMTGREPLDQAIARKMNERIKRIFERDGLLQGGTSPKKD